MPSASISRSSAWRRVVVLSRGIVREVNPPMNRARVLYRQRTHSRARVPYALRHTYAQNTHTHARTHARRTLKPTADEPTRRRALVGGGGGGRGWVGVNSDIRRVKGHPGCRPPVPSPPRASSVTRARDDDDADDRDRDERTRRNHPRIIT